MRIFNTWTKQTKKTECLELARMSYCDQNSVCPLFLSIEKSYKALNTTNPLSLVSIHSFFYKLKASIEGKSWFNNIKFFLWNTLMSSVINCTPNNNNNNNSHSYNDNRSGAIIIIMQSNEYFFGKRVHLMHLFLLLIWFAVVIFFSIRRITDKKALKSSSQMWECRAANNGRSTDTVRSKTRFRLVKSLDDRTICPVIYTGKDKI